MRKRGIKRKGHPHQPRAAASSNTGLLGPAAQSGFPMSQSGDLAPGWFPLKHNDRLPCYYHATSGCQLVRPARRPGWSPSMHRAQQVHGATATGRTGGQAGIQQLRPSTKSPMAATGGQVGAAVAPLHRRQLISSHRMRSSAARRAATSSAISRVGVVTRSQNGSNSLRSQWYSSACTPRRFSQHVCHTNSMCPPKGLGRTRLLAAA